MNNTGRYGVYKIVGNKMILESVVEPINEFPDRNADWGKTDTTNLPTGGSVTEKESIITEANGFKNIRYINKK